MAMLLMIVAVNGTPIFSRYTSEKKLAAKSPMATTPMATIRSHANQDVRRFTDFIRSLRNRGEGTTPPQTNAYFSSFVEGRQGKRDASQRARVGNGVAGRSIARRGSENRARRRFNGA